MFFPSIAYSEYLSPYLWSTVSCKFDKSLVNFAYLADSGVSNPLKITILAKMIITIIVIIKLIIDIPFL